MAKKTIKKYNQITISISDPFLNYIDSARMLPGTKEKFGKQPTQDQFLKGVIYYWIKKHAPEVLIEHLNDNVPEISEHNALKH